MAGTSEGSRKAVAKILARDPDHFKKIGASGGRNGKGIFYNGGFASTSVGKDGLTGYERATIAGKKGGEVPRRRDK